MLGLDLKIAYLWAKKGKNNNWLPLVVHMLDTAGVAERLWENWLNQNLKIVLTDNILGNDFENLEDEDEVKKLFIFLAMIHDLGKATPVFQAKESSFPPSSLDFEILKYQLQVSLVNDDRGSRGFPVGSQTPHSLASALIMEREGISNNISAIVGAHHGKPLSNNDFEMRNIEIYPKNFHFGKDGKNVWISVQRELIQMSLKYAGYESVFDLPNPNMAAQILLSGMLIVADWLASNEGYFPYYESVLNWQNEFSYSDLLDRADSAWEEINFPEQWHPGFETDADVYYQKRFGKENIDFVPNLLQISTFELAKKVYEPGIFIIEAPMGIGKTEAALALAEKLALQSFSSGLFFALPTQATSNSMYSRIEDWVNKLGDESRHSIRLAHSKAQFNDNYRRLFEGSSNVDIDDAENSGLAFVHQWFEGNKKALLADFVIGTIDQLLMVALKQKHVMLRHLALTGKIVIIDECHAYDVYMSQYLHRALHYLGVYKIPVIILSATLPFKKRKELFAAYSGEPVDSVEVNVDSKMLYPLITWLDSNKYHFMSVAVEGEGSKIRMLKTDEKNMLNYFQDERDFRGCIGIIRNTVKKAQETALKLKEIHGDRVVLLHSRFLPEQRAVLEKQITEKLGKNKGLNRPEFIIVVGTQVLEQSLDIDFDLMFTDLCPMDLLIQRIGRLHRHKRVRPKNLTDPLCYVLDIEENPDNVAIYGSYLLLKTDKSIPNQLCLPNDIPFLVNELYEENLCDDDRELNEEFEKYKGILQRQERKARDYRLDGVHEGSLSQNLTSWLDTAKSDKASEAAVRDTEDSIEVILLKKHDEIMVKTLYGKIKGQLLDSTKMPSSYIAREISKQKIVLPAALCKLWTIDQTLAELENTSHSLFSAWGESSWLKGEVYIVLDEEGEAEVNGYILKYDHFLGLEYYGKEGIDGSKKV